MNDDVLLVARLRAIPEYPVCREAAQRIEELVADIDTLHQIANGLCELLDRADRKRMELAQQLDAADEAMIIATEDAEAGWGWAYAFDQTSGHAASGRLPAEAKERFQHDLQRHEDLDV